MKIFLTPILISAVALVGVLLWGGTAAFILVATLSVLEITLSFDNAVINAKVLSHMNALWQKRFLTWGIALAVFGTRLILPALIVAIAAMISPLKLITLAVQDPAQYAALIGDAAPLIKAFGGSFLLLVSLNYFIDEYKKLHWIEFIEKRLARWGRIEALELAIALVLLMGVSYVTHAPQGSVLIAGGVGIVLFIIMQGITSVLDSEKKDIARTGLLFFAYLNVLDAAFSLDGVIGAFALTTLIPIIFVGLGVGAYFVRAITLYLVQKRTLTSLVYLEHGAHWAICGLALSMYVGLVMHVPEVVTGTIGLVFVALSYVSSIRENAKRARL